MAESPENSRVECNVYISFETGAASVRSYELLFILACFRPRTTPGIRSCGHPGRSAHGQS